MNRREIEFTIMASSAEGMQPLLDQFEAENHIHVRLRLLSWDSAWRMLVRAALYGDGPDVSEVGTTWIGDLIGMNALRPFDAAEVVSLKKASAFFPTAWKTVTQRGEPHVWAIPWLVGARLLYYRKAWCAKAGIDLSTAFKTNAALDNTIGRLQDSGVKIPWTVPTGFTHTTLLNISSWVWAAGGDFLNEEGTATRFMEPEALEGMRAYFSLGRYLTPEVCHLNGLEPDDRFLFDLETAMTISGPWLFCKAREQRPNNCEQQVGVALPPGASFVGGSNLVVWKRAHDPEAAMKLIHFLTQPSAQVHYSQHIGLLPARLEALEQEPFSNDPLWQTAVQGLITGRSFPTIRLWGLVEDRLATSFHAIWGELLADPGLDPQVPLVRHLEPLAQRLDHLLSD